MLLNEERKVKLINQEMKLLATNNSSPAASPVDSRRDTPADAAPLLSLECIKDRTDPTISLKDIVEGEEDGREYRMECERSQKLFEVKTKALPKIWPGGYRLVVVKDQTVYEQLFKERTMEMYQRMLISSISHEIRNPLNAIQSYASTILETSRHNLETAAQCKKVDLEIRRIDYTLSGACDLMMAAGESTGIIDSKMFKPFNLKSAIQEVQEMVQPGLEQKPIQLRFTIGGTVPDDVCSDPKKYKLILFNLLSNAAKYTHEGSITVTLRYTPSSRVLYTQVEDTGSGIPHSQLDNLFSLYANMQHLNPYNPQGMGLGLTLCKKLARSLGGDISASSEQGKGSTFRFHIKTAERPLTLQLPESEDEGSQIELVPCERSGGEVLMTPMFGEHHSTRPGESASAFFSSSSGCKCAPVLVVDDEATNRLALKSYLKSLGVQPDEAENGKIALRLIQQRAEAECCKKYKLILMDINMPEMDGTTATAEIVHMFELGKWGRCPVVAVTAANVRTGVDMQNLLSVGFSEIGTICVAFFG